MTQHTPKPRSSPRLQHQQQQRLNPSIEEQRCYTSFRDLGVLSPRNEEFEKDSSDDSSACANHPETGAGKDSYKGVKEVVKGDGGNRERSASMRWMEWLVRPKGACSPP